MRLRRIPALATIALAVLTLAGCSERRVPTEQRLLDEQEAKWRATAPTSYTLLQRRDCICADGGRTARLNVVSGVLRGAVWLDDGSEVAAARLNSMRTVEGLFLQIRAARAQGALTVEADFDPQYGFPTLVRVDVIAGDERDDYAFVSSALTPLTAAR